MDGHVWFVVLLCVAVLGFLGFMGYDLMYSVMPARAAELRKDAAKRRVDKLA